MGFFDSHAHLEHERFAEDRDQVVERARDAGVTSILTCASDLRSSQEEIDLAGRYEGVYAAVGVHCHQALSFVESDSDQSVAPTVDEALLSHLAELATAPGVVAVGEIGLDYHYDFAPRDVQRQVLSRQLELACALDTPVVLHNRESDADLRRIVDAAPRSLRGVLHCFLSDLPMARWALSRGLHIGIAGPITFRSAKYLIDVLPHVPLDRLLIETDCPYLTPAPKRGKRNEPALVVYVAEKVAQVLDRSLEEIARRSTENACRLFGIG